MPTYPLLLIATSNPGKISEFQDLLKSFHLNLCTPDEMGIKQIPQETGSTYLENAMLKAQFYFNLGRMAVLADDTGLEVEVLGGEPGLYSARISSQTDADDAERRRLLLEKLADKAEPWVAFFICTAVLIDQQGHSHAATGRCKGQIITQERGNNGFGYDPIFLFPELGKTMAELELREKNLISHRAQAIRSLSPELLKLSINDR